MFCSDFFSMVASSCDSLELVLSLRISFMKASIFDICSILFGTDFSENIFAFKPFLLNEFLLYFHWIILFPPPPPTVFCVYAFSSTKKLMIVFFSYFSFSYLFLLLNHPLFHHSSRNQSGLKSHLSHLYQPGLKESHFLWLHHWFEGFTFTDIFFASSTTCSYITLKFTIFLTRTFWLFVDINKISFVSLFGNQVWIRMKNLLMYHHMIRLSYHMIRLNELSITSMDILRSKTKVQIIWDKRFWFPLNKTFLSNICSVKLHMKS